MRKFLVSVFFLLVAFCIEAQLVRNQVNVSGHGTVYFYQFTPTDYKTAAPGSPLIISLGGVGEQGNGTTELDQLFVGGIPRLLHAGATMKFTYGAKTEGFVVLAPQLPKNNAWENFYTDAMIDYGINTLHVDPSRIFLTGYSLGGVGVWQYATSDPNNAAKLAGIAPISAGFPSSPNYCDIAQNKLATWAFHSADDGNYPGNPAGAIISQINQCSNLMIPAVDTLYPDGAHAIWDPRVYDTTNNTHYPNLYQWMLMVNRNIDLANNQSPVPVISLGSNITLTTPVKVKDFPVLDGTGSHDDDVIVDYLWESASSPSGTSISFPRDQWPVTTLNAVSQSGNFALPIGTYNLRLRVKDYLTSAVYGSKAHTKFADLSVTVDYPKSGPSANRSAPATDAGGTRTIASNVTQVLQIPGNAYFYPCDQCGYDSYSWTQISGPSATLSNYNNPSLPYPAGSNYISFTNLNSPGTYQFKFSATAAYVGPGGERLVGSDIFTVIKLGALPVTYSYFNGQNAGNKNTLSWATTEEVNSERFDVLRSTDGVNFSVIGTEASHGGAVLTSYTFDDNNAPAGLAYYRLSQVDKDGKSALSKIISVSNRKTGLYIERYPNPVHDNLTVTAQGNTNGTMHVVIADMQGKTILQQQWQKDLSLLKKVINVSSLQNGVYQMIVTMGQEKQVSSFVKY